MCNHKLFKMNELKVKRESLVQLIENYLTENPGDRDEITRVIENSGKSQIERDIEDWNQSANH